ncbi:MAG: hypothetical protein QOI47_2458 [Actinomycetota bacterium]|jgi:transcriptional regulator with XRE-family HTH domain|nr:hypothetical protein [Actinomycetota bacterium]
MDVAARVRTERRRAGLSQRELATRAQVPQSTVARVESGAHSPRVDTLERLLAACGRALEITDLLGIGVDRSQIRELLELDVAARFDRAAGDADGLAELGW